MADKGSPVSTLGEAAWHSGGGDRTPKPVTRTSMSSLPLSTGISREPMLAQTSFDRRIDENCANGEYPMSTDITSLGKKYPAMPEASTPDSFEIFR